MIQLCGYDAELSSVFAQDDYVFWRHKFIGSPLAGWDSEMV